MKRTLMEFMNDTKEVNRWFVLRVGLFGAFCGALLMAIMAIAGIA